MTASQNTLLEYKGFALVMGDGSRLSPFFETPLTYSQGRRAYRLRYGDDYGYGSYLRERGSNGFLEFKRGRRVIFGDKKCCWIGHPGKWAPREDCMHYIKRRLTSIHSHPIYAFEQYIKGIGGVFFSVTLRGVKTWWTLIPGMGDPVQIVFRQHNCAVANLCHVRRKIEAGNRKTAEDRELIRRRGRGAYDQKIREVVRAYRGGRKVKAPALSRSETEKEEIEGVVPRRGVILVGPEFNKSLIRRRFNVEPYHVPTPLYVPDFTYDYMEQQQYPGCVTDIYVLYGRIHDNAAKFFTWYAQRRLGPNWGYVLWRRGVDFRMHSNVVDGTSSHTEKIQKTLRLIYNLALEDPKYHVRLDWFLGDETRYRIKSEREYWLQFNSTGKPPPA